MLSILIPVYNFDINLLVESLHRQCLEAHIDFEIICFDDGSTGECKTQNRTVKHLPNVVYREMSVNLGRSKIRNELARSARHDYLLFMDCDSGLVSDRYISNYLSEVAPDRVLYGGRTYRDTPPADPELFFHWKYGREREQSKPEEREKQPYHSFMTNNFLIPKALFLDICLDENLKQYGHEDTLFGLELRKRKIPIKHFDNPLEHLGLESVSVFLNKTVKGIENLYFLFQNNELIETRLLGTFQKLRASGLIPLVGYLLSLARPFILKNLHSKNPGMRLFDLYKLFLLIKESQKK